ncbi:MAG TPA: alpha-amylase family glycosyl hydrolase [Kiritimatiellia bacterium]|nr:alpha-amylase family glycosyl hydrolase [Kiritimatiellia bacterium]HSA19530.1 alpha-amylase family glycosyl hydrolase [Kiritimatiellia bacterium]
METICRKLAVSVFLMELAWAGVARAALGNSWHIPANAEPPSVTMRNPLSPGYAEAVTIYNGTYKGSPWGSENNQTGGWLVYRKSGAGWSSSVLQWDADGPSGYPNNQYWRAAIPAGTFAAGDVIQYYLKITYSDRDDTYLYNNNAKTGVESTAQGDPVTFTMSPGTPVLTVNGLNANYTTSKFFIDEAAGETQRVTVAFTVPAGVTSAAVEVFSNLDRRDWCEVDVNSDGVPDGIRPPDANVITTNDTGAYFRAWPMTPVGGNAYVWTGTVSRTGAYRLTARYRLVGAAATNWWWYTDGGRRDHAVVVSPRKALDLRMYELNALTVESTWSSEAGRSTFVDLLSVAQGDSDGFDRFNLEYLDGVGANCLWFQPIHPNAVERGDGLTPGSPYSTRDYFAVSKWFGGDGTEAGALAEFTNFVAQADAHTGATGRIHVMLDGVFNHTSWDAEVGQGAVDLGFAADPNARMGGTQPGWYSLITDYGLPATYYTNAGTNDFATAPDRGDFGKWPDTADLFFGRYSALVRHNPENNNDYNSESDWMDFAGLTSANIQLWKLFAYYPEYWIRKTGHPGTNTYDAATDDKGIDGLRCDFGQGLPPQCWEYIINRTRKFKWNFIFMAETLDGGNPGYRSNRHFDILNENLVFQFTQSHINDSWDVRSAIESRRTSYGQGLVLLNLTSHDEVLPDNDCWLVASRYGALSTVDGVPMIFYGQEQGIQNYNSSDPGGTWYYDGFREDHEENFGKYIPHFKKWNQLTVWSNPPPNSGGIAEWYGKVNRARRLSPALRSHNRYFLSKVGGGEEARILAVAKYETANAGPAASDVVLAFSLLLRHGEAHTGSSATYNLQPVWTLLGLNTGKSYNVRNLAASNPDQLLTSGWPKTGASLYNDGIWVNLPADTGGAITDDGALVQYLKLEEVSTNAAPSISLPGPHWLAVGSATNFSVTASDGNGNAVTLTNTVKPSGATFAAGVFAWTALPAELAGTTQAVVFVADDGQGATNSIVTNATQIVVPFDSDGDGMPDGWEWDSFASLTNPPAGDWDGDELSNLDEYTAGTTPTDGDSIFAVETPTPAGTISVQVPVRTVPGRKYTIYFADDLGGDWSPFANPAQGIGTWTETGGSPSVFSFTDDGSADTTAGPPLEGRRFYRVKVEKP